MAGRPKQHDDPDPATRDLRERIAELEIEVGTLRAERHHLLELAKKLEAWERLTATAERMGCKVGIVGPQSQVLK